MLISRCLPRAFVAGALLLAGWSGGSGLALALETASPPVAFDLPGGDHGLVSTGAAPLEIGAGATARRGNVEFACAAGGPACIVNIVGASGDDTTRTAAYKGAGSTVTAMAAREALAAPGNRDVTDAITLAAAPTPGNECVAPTAQCAAPEAPGNAELLFAQEGAPALPCNTPFYRACNAACLAELSDCKSDPDARCQGPFARCKYDCLMKHCSR